MDVWELRPLCLQGYNTSSLHRKTKVHVSWYKGTLCRYGSLILVAGKISRWIYVHHQYDMPHSETTNTPVSSHTLQVQTGWVIEDSSKTANWGEKPKNQNFHSKTSLKITSLHTSVTPGGSLAPKPTRMYSMKLLQMYWLIMTLWSTQCFLWTFLNTSDALTTSRPSNIEQCISCDTYWYLHSLPPLSLYLAIFDCIWDNGLFFEWWDDSWR